MKFIISQDGTITVNSAFIRTMYIEEESASYKDNHTVVRVKAELNNDSGESKTDYSNSIVTLSTFDSGNFKADYAQAQVYLKNLVAELNGGTK